MRVKLDSLEAGKAKVEQKDNSVRGTIIIPFTASGDDPSLVAAFAKAVATKKIKEAIGTRFERNDEFLGKQSIEFGAASVKLGRGK